MKIRDALYRIPVVTILIALTIVSLGFGVLARAAPPARRNVVIFVADGLRHGVVDAENTPHLLAFSRTGVSFSNSHATYPTFTMANASVISTGHFVADTGIFANALLLPFSVGHDRATTVPFLENDAVLTEINSHYDAGVMNGETLLTVAAKNGYNVAAVGKLGPTLIQMLPQAARASTIVVDDDTGSPAAMLPLPQSIKDALVKAGLPTVPPPRGKNGGKGTKVANTAQQDYFARVATQVLLPRFKREEKPFALVFWSRDPDGTQHNQGDSPNSWVPGINGPTTFAAIRNADENFGRLLATLHELNLDGVTDVAVTSDHGFSTISRESATSVSRNYHYEDTPAGQLPPGFLAIDLAHAFHLKIFDPDREGAEVSPQDGRHPQNAWLGNSRTDAKIVVAANGGSDLIYLLGTEFNPATARRICEFLLTQDYVGGIFVAKKLGPIAGTLSTSDVGLDTGDANTPPPSIFVSFRSFTTGCPIPTNCGVVVSDTFMSQGQGMHGSFGRQDTFNFTALGGPDFKTEFSDPAPVSNADLAGTLAHVLGFKIPHSGSRKGRILSETLVGGKVPAFSRHRLKSVPYAGLRTVIRYQIVGAGDATYFDAAGIPGRTLGLEDLKAD